MHATLQQQVSNATRSQIEGQLAAWTALHNTLLEGVAKLADLNMQAVRESIDGSATLSRDLFKSANPQEFFATATEQFQPNIERLATYGHHTMDIANGIGAGIGRVVQEEIASVNQQPASTMKDLFGPTPVGAASLADWMRTAFDAANAGYEQLIGTTTQMTKAMEENVSMTPPVTMRPSSQSNGSARKK